MAPVAYNTRDRYPRRKTIKPSFPGRSNSPRDIICARLSSVWWNNYSFGRESCRVLANGYRCTDPIWLGAGTKNTIAQRLDYVAFKDFSSSSFFFFSSFLSKNLIASQNSRITNFVICNIFVAFNSGLFFEWGSLDVLFNRLTELKIS